MIHSFGSWWATWSTVAWRVSLQIWGILVRRNPPSFTLSYVSASPMVMGIWVPVGTVPRGEVQNVDGSRPGYQLLAILVQSAGSLMDLWKEGGNQKACCLQDGQPGGAAEVGVTRRRERGERIQVGFVQLCSYLLLSSTRETLGMLCYLTTTKCSLAVSCVLPNVAWGYLSAFPCNTNLLSRQGKQINQTLQLSR